MTSRVIAVGALLCVVAAPAAFAGPPDPLRISPPTWQQPAAPKSSQPYALTGGREPQRTPTSSDDRWRREVQRFGGKVDRDVYVR